MVISREFWCEVRRALLILLDAVEAMIDIQPRNKDLRKNT